MVGDAQDPAAAATGPPVTVVPDDEDDEDEEEPDDVELGAEPANEDAEEGAVGSSSSVLFEN